MSHATDIAEIPDFRGYREGLRSIGTLTPDSRRFKPKLRNNDQLSAITRHFRHAYCQLYRRTEAFPQRSRCMFFESWWERVPLYARFGLVVLSILGMLLGGAADGYWE